MGFLQGALTLAVKDPDMPAPSNVFPISEPHCHMLLIEKVVFHECFCCKFIVVGCYIRGGIRTPQITRNIY